MARKGGIQEGPASRVAEYYQTYLHHFEMNAAVATDGIQYSPVATVGTTAIEILSEMIDLDLILRLKSIEVGLTQRFSNLGASLQASMAGYYWEGAREKIGTTLNWVNITGTLTKNIPTSSNSEDTFSGYLPVASLPETPLRFRLVANGIIAGSFYGQVKSSSYIKLIGSIIPGT